MGNIYYESTIPFSFCFGSNSYDSIRRKLGFLVISMGIFVILGLKARLFSLRHAKTITFFVTVILIIIFIPRRQNPGLEGRGWKRGRDSAPQGAKCPGNHGLGSPLQLHFPRTNFSRLISDNYGVAHSRNPIFYGLIPE